MAARKGQNRRWRRRGRFGGLYKLLSFLIIFAAILVGCVVFFRVNEVRVVGNSRYSVQEIIAASGVEVGDNLFLVNRPQTANAIMKRLPYVESATPVHILPDTVELRVTESHAVAAVEAEGSWWLVNAGGKLLEKGERPIADGYPKVRGFSPQAPAVGSRMTASLEEQTRLEGIKGLLTALAERGMEGNAREFIDLSSNNVIRFDYGGDLTVVVPASGDFSRRIFSLQRVLETFAQRGERVTGTLDLTYGEDEARLLTERWLPEDYLPPLETDGPVAPQMPEPTLDPAGDLPAPEMPSIAG